MNTATTTSTGLQSLSISQRIIAGSLALMLGLTTLAFVVLGESLRDALDPKARR